MADAYADMQHGWNFVYDPVVWSVPLRQLYVSAYLFYDIPAGSYNFSYVPQDTIHKPAQRNVSVTLGQTTTVDTVKLVR